MSYSDDVERLLLKVRDAATSAYLAGAKPDEVDAAIEEGIREGERIHNLRWEAYGYTSSAA
jgi:hypothetical protein